MANTRISAPNPMEEMVTVHIPKVSGEDRMFYVGLNGKGWNIPRGKNVQVPKPVADIIERHNLANERADKYKEERQRMMNIVQGV